MTDWRDYDSIYTERFMGLPQDNPEGYNVSSVVKAAGKLHGKLLILHGAIDDNVSLRNTMRLVQALQLANKDFELMIYPSSRHGIGGAHYQRIQQDFIRRTLLTPKPEKEKTGSPGDIATPRLRPRGTLLNRRAGLGVVAGPRRRRSEKGLEECHPDVRISWEPRVTRSTVRFTIRQMIVAIAVIGVALGLLVQVPFLVVAGAGCRSSELCFLQGRASSFSQAALPVGS